MESKNKVLYITYRVFQNSINLWKVQIYFHDSARLDQIWARYSKVFHKQFKTKTAANKYFKKYIKHYRVEYPNIAYFCGYQPVSWKYPTGRKPLYPIKFYHPKEQ